MPVAICCGLIFSISMQNNLKQISQGVPLVTLEGIIPPPLFFVFKSHFFQVQQFLVPLDYKELQFYLQTLPFS